MSLVRDWLRIREAGTPKFRILPGCCPNLVKQFDRYMRKVVDNVILDEPRNGRECHAMQCLEYMAGYMPQWHKPKAVPKQGSFAYQAFMELENGPHRRGRSLYIHLGPGPSPEASPSWF